MLSIKWTFSLTSLVLILALCFVAPSAFAFEIKLSVANTLDIDTGNADVSFADGNQVLAGRKTTINIVSEKVVTRETSLTEAANASAKLEAIDFKVTAYNKHGGIETVPALEQIKLTDGLVDDGRHFSMILPSGDAAVITRVVIALPAGAKDAEVVVHTSHDKDGKQTTAHNAASKPLILHFVDPAEGTAIGTIGTDGAFSAGTADGDVGKPIVHAIARADGMLRPVTAATFDVLITLSEEPKKDGFKKDHINVSNADPGDPTFLDKIPETDTMKSSGRDMMLYRYIVTLTPKYENKHDIVVKVKSFYDQEKAMPKMYMPPSQEIDYKEGMDKLTVKVGKEDLKAKVAGSKVTLAKDNYIPGGGYVVVVEDVEASEIINPDPNDDVSNQPLSHQRSPAGLMYNLQDLDIPNLETFLSNGGIIDVVSPIPLVITEVMWGSDQSLVPAPGNAQWIELYNAGEEKKIAENTIDLMFYGHSETPPARKADGSLPDGVTDRIGTIGGTGGSWSLAGKGQSGRTGHGEGKDVALAAAVPYTNIVSMFRVKDTTGAWANGQDAASWMASMPPSDNFDPAQPGHRVGTPGAPTDMSGLEAAAAAAEKAKTDAAAKAKADAEAKAAATGTVPQAGNIYISEVMFAGGGSLPQWIEIANGSRTEEINLSGWTLTIDNAAGDADVSVGGSIVFTIPVGTMIGTYGQNDKPSTIVVVTEMGRTNLTGEMASGQILDLWTVGQTELILAGVTKRRYSLLSSDAFLITLAPPAPTATKLAATATKAEKATAQAADTIAKRAHAAATDMAGNLGADGAAAWALPMNMEGGRSSILRTHVQVSVGPAEPNDGMMMDGWALASDTSFAQATHVRASSYYGAANDVGTPGFRAGGALPVQLSQFRPARDAAGAVVITWSTQSELNNAGFFIKRSQQRDGQFQVINATMVAGAGTSSEKQFYTYTDTTAQPNVVYYYQIEDVSLDGQRQTLTRGIRLKGHVGAAGKATTTWGDLKTQE